MKNQALGVAVMISALLPNMASSQSYMNAGRYDLKDYVTSADCNSNGCDLYPAFVAVIAACQTLRNSQGQPLTGCIFEVPEGRHRLTQTVELCRQHSIVGAGDWNSGANTVIYAEKTAFWARGYGYCNSQSLGGPGNITIKGVSVFATANAQANAYPSHCSTTPSNDCGIFGVLAEARVRLQDMSIRAFTQNVRIVADVTFSPASEASMWSLANMWLSEAEHANLFVQGGDVNAGSFVAGQVAQGCNKASIWNSRTIGLTQGPQDGCACLVDKSWLGNAYVGLHTAGCKDTATNVAYHSYKFHGSANRSACVGCYAEADSARAYKDTGTVVVAGTSFWIPYGQVGGSGLLIDGAQLSPFTVINRLGGTGNTVAVQIGTTPGSAIEAMRLTGPDGEIDSLPHFRLSYNSTRKSFALGVGAGQSMSLAGETGSSDGSFVGELRINCGYAPSMVGHGCVQP